MPMTATIRPEPGTTSPVPCTTRTWSSSPSTTGKARSVVAPEQLGERVEVADVVPAERRGHDRHPPGVGRRLGDGVVDGDLGQRRPQLVEPGRDPPRCRAAWRRTWGRTPRAGPAARSAAPRTCRRSSGTGRSRGTRGPCAPTASRRRPAPGTRPGGSGSSRAEVDVAERRRRGDGVDADRDQPVVPGDLDREPHRLAEHPGLGDHVVGGEGPHDGVRVPALEHRGGQPDRGHRVPGGRLGHDRRRRPAPGSCSATASRCAAPVTTMTRSAVSGPEPVEGALDQGAAGAGEVEEELRGHRPRQRPEPGARTPGGDDGPEVVDRPRRLSHGSAPYGWLRDDVRRDPRGRAPA